MSRIFIGETPYNIRIFTSYYGARNFVQKTLKRKMFDGDYILWQGSTATVYNRNHRPTQLKGYAHAT